MKDDKIIEVDANDLPLSCPPKDTPAWNLHPRVYLDITDTGEVTCPYCDKHYKLKDGVKVHSH
ncbi:zinc-finger domain-containing protein [Basilea psittacipulmonis]|uniref:Zinc finger CHCC-type domain-containing protein n=1 Tax=Basilea psittacipulmonis DSM 24701 TaxID=1072685 RepID=A0A077DC12_9BURK|nr:zinc-finger domain-containing protein [Basilea psittacipulmonis]AIL32390.1 hypothetical protein IX83_02815 [Basilea psittacipulmonis DSM 24701]